MCIGTLSCNPHTLACAPAIAAILFLFFLHIYIYCLNTFLCPRNCPHPTHTAATLEEEEEEEEEERSLIVDLKRHTQLAVAPWNSLDQTAYEFQ